MPQKNQIYETTITGMSSEGDGIGRVGGLAVFIPFALTGERVEVKIIKVLKNHAYGRLERILEPSPHRVEPACPYFYQCGGCGFWHADYAFELAYKQEKVAQALRRLGGINMPLRPILASERTTGYRNKAIFPVTPEGIGFYARRSHRLVPIKNCIIQHASAAPILQAVREVMAQYKIAPYDEQTHTGDIRHVYTRAAQGTGELMVCIVTRNEVLPHGDKLAERLLSLGLPIVSIVQSVNSRRTNVALGERERVLWGKGSITDTFSGLTFSISPKAFYQINTGQMERMYAEAVSMAGLTGDERVLDLYCGIGTITLYAARRAREAVGVEIVAEAVENAKANAAANGCENVRFLEGAAEQLAPKLGCAQAVIVDPPRKGCDERLLQAIREISPKRLVYISCNPATLARDLRILMGYGYLPRQILPVDMFPKTSHVECVVCLQRADTL